MMSMVSNFPLYIRGGDMSIYITVESYVADAINANPFCYILDICKSVVLKKFIDIIEVINLCEVNFHIYERSKRNSRVDTYM